MLVGCGVKVGRGVLVGARVGVAAGSDVGVAAGVLVGKGVGVAVGGVGGVVAVGIGAGVCAGDAVAVGVGTTAIAGVTVGAGAGGGVVQAAAATASMKAIMEKRTRMDIALWYSWANCSVESTAIPTVVEATAVSSAPTMMIPAWQRRKAQSGQSAFGWGIICPYPDTMLETIRGTSSQIQG